MDNIKDHHQHHPHPHGDSSASNDKLHNNVLFWTPGFMHRTNETTYVYIQNPSDMIDPFNSNQNFMTIVVTHAITFVIGVIGNSVVIATWARGGRIRSSTASFLVSLACADLMLLIIFMPLETLEYFVITWDRDGRICKLSSFVELLSGMSSILNLVAVSVERFLVIVYPMQARRWCTVAKSRRSLILVWLLAILFAAPPVLNKSTYSMTYYNNQTAITAYYCFEKNDNWAIVFSIYELMSLFILPAILMLFCYSRVIRELWASTRVITVLTSTTTRQRSATPPKQPPSSSLNQQQQQQHLHHPHHPHPHHHQGGRSYLVRWSSATTTTTTKKSFPVEISCYCEGQQQREQQQSNKNNRHQSSSSTNSSGSRVIDHHHHHHHNQHHRHHHHRHCLPSGNGVYGDHHQHHGNIFSCILKVPFFKRFAQKQSTKTQKPCMSEMPEPVPSNQIVCKNRDIHHHHHHHRPRIMPESISDPFPSVSAINLNMDTGRYGGRGRGSSCIKSNDSLEARSTTTTNNSLTTQRSCDSVQIGHLPIEGHCWCCYSSLCSSKSSSSSVMVHQCNAINKKSTATVTADVRNARRQLYCQVIKMLLLIVILFHICWGPRLVFNVIKSTGHLGQFDEFAYSARVYFYLLSFIHSALNPFVYGFMSSNFRRMMSNSCNLNRHRKHHYHIPEENCKEATNSLAEVMATTSCLSAGLKHSVSPSSSSSSSSTSSSPPTSSKLREHNNNNNNNNNDNFFPVSLGKKNENDKKLERSSIIKPMIKHEKIVMVSIDSPIIELSQSDCCSSSSSSGNSKSNTNRNNNNKNNNQKSSKLLSRSSDFVSFLVVGKNTTTTTTTTAAANIETISTTSTDNDANNNNNKTLTTLTRTKSLQCH